MECRNRNIRTLPPGQKSQQFADAKVVRLEQNYRSTKTILKAASALITNNVQRKNKSLWTNNEQGALIKIIFAADEREEARNVARELRDMFDKQKMRWDEMAVLYRINSLSRVLEDSLMEAAIPYQIVRGTEFYARKEVKDALAYMRLLVNPSDRVSFERIINVPTRGIGPGSVDRIISFAQEKQINLVEACRHAQEIGGLTKKPPLPPYSSPPIWQPAALNFRASSIRRRIYQPK